MIADVVREAARRFGEQTALVAPDGRLTYRELWRRTEEVASGLVRLGVGPGSIVGLCMRSSAAYVLAYLGATRVGAVCAGINPRLSPPERSRIAARLEPDLVLAHEDLTEGLEGLVVTELPAGDGGSPPRLPPDPDRPVAVVFTSGTTGEPKGAVFCNRQLAHITMLEVGGRWGGGTPLLVSTELVHVGFMTKLPWYLRLGSRLHLLERWRAAEALRTIAEERIPSVGGIAAQIALMLRLPEFDDYDLSCVETIVVGGGPSPPALIAEARRRFGAAYSVRYSSTESGGVGTLTAFDAPDEEALFTVGRPRLGIELAVRDGEGCPLPPGEVGEVTLRSPATMSEYWRDPEATRRTLRHGWLYTGDLGFVDERGCLRLVGRCSDVFIRGGYNVHPMEVEAVLAEHPGVAHVAIVPRPDPVMGEIGVAVVVPRPGHPPPTLHELQAFARQRLAAYKVPEALRLVDGLPLTPQHKVDRRRLTDEEREGT